MSSGVQPLQAIAILIRKFGKRIPNGGFEVEISHLELKELSQYGMLNEVPELDRHVLRWQYYPNTTIEGELTPEGVTPTGELTEPNDEQRRPLQHPETDDETPA